MKKRGLNLDEGAPLSAGGGGGGRALGTGGRLTRPGAGDPMTDRAAGQIEQSVRDRGGYPTRNGQPMKTKMQERMEQRKAKFNFRKGGMVKGTCRDYGK